MNNKGTTVFVSESTRNKNQDTKGYKMELEDPSEVYVPEFLKTDQEQIDYNMLKRQVMKHDAQMAKIMFCIVMTGIGGLMLAILHPEFNKSNGVVVWRDSSTVYVQDLKDTADYYAFAQDKKMLVDSKRAFPLIERGDTVRFRAANKRLVNLSADVATRNVILDSVNNKSVEDLKRIYTGKHISKTK